MLNLEDIRNAHIQYVRKRLARAIKDRPDDMNTIFLSALMADFDKTIEKRKMNGDDEGTSKTKLAVFAGTANQADTYAMYHGIKPNDWFFVSDDPSCLLGRHPGEFVRVGTWYTRTRHLEIMSILLSRGYQEKGEQTMAVSDSISKEELLKMRVRLNTKADELLDSKGNDYNSQQQNAGDTLYNLRVCAILGIVPSPVDGILVRLSDKFMRLISLTRPGVVQKVKDESLEDTVIDIRNYVDYLLAMVKRERGEPIE